MDFAHPAVIGSVVALVAGLGALFGLRWWRQRQRPSIESALRAIGVEHLRDVLVPDGMGGEIHVEHLILTARGIVVVDVKRYQGVIFASDRMDQWTSIGPDGRSTFQNPIGTLYDRVAAVRQLVRDVDVAGFVLFPPAADFSKGQPKDVVLPDDLVERYAKPEREQIGKLNDAFAPHWEKIRQAVRPASD